MDMAQIQNTMIFRGMTEEEISSALSHLQAEEKRYEKGQRRDRSFYMPEVSQKKWAWFWKEV